MSEHGTDRVRASDAEREEVAAMVRAAMGDGRLTLDEGEERLAAVYAASYRDELPGLTADLPPADPPPAGRGSAGGARSRRHRPSVAGPAVGLVVVAAVVAGIWAASAGATLWPAIVLGILAVVLVKRARRGGHWPASPCRGQDRQPATPPRPVASHDR